MGRARSRRCKFALSPPSERLWASLLALQTSDFLSIATRVGNRTWTTLRAAAQMPRGLAGVERAARAPRNFVPSVERGPRSAGAGSSRCGSAATALLLSPPRHGGRSALSHPRPRESNSLAGRAAELAKGEEAGASRRRRRGAGSPERSSRPPPGRPLQPRGPRVRGSPAPFRKSIWPRRPARNARGRGAGLSRGGGCGAPVSASEWPGRPDPLLPETLTFPLGKTWAPRSSRGWGRGRRPRGAAAAGSRAEPGPGCAPAGAGGKGAGTRRAETGSGAIAGDPAAQLADAATSVTRAAASPHQGFPGLSASGEDAAPARALSEAGAPQFRSRGTRAAQVRGAEARGATPPSLPS